MPTKYLAITIAGAVSLGSYEAGAMYEILDAIRQHNAHPETIAKGDYIRIDVITGASAGGMTAAILAQKLLYQKSTLVNANGGASPYENPLYEAWVRTITLAGLVNTVDKPVPDGDPATLSLLSSNLIEHIAQETLLQQDSSGQIPIVGGMHNAIDPQRGIRLGLALTNINGLNYGRKMFDGTDFLYTDFSDQMIRSIAATDRSLATWTEIAQAAVGCGAFPFAFRTKDLKRPRADFDDDLEPWPGDPNSHVFTYTDGGVLQNQPLGMAKNLVDKNDNHLGDEQRFYLFVSPSPMEGTQNLSLSEKNVTLIGIGRRLLSTYLGQAIYHDWVQAEDVNSQIRLLDLRAEQLAAALKSQAVDAVTFAASAQQVLSLMYSTVPSQESEDQALARLAQQYSAEVDGFGGPQSPETTALLKGILTLELAAELGDRDRMRIYGLVTNDGNLAGAGIFAFVGFFDQAYRDHDYDWGRTVAQRLLANPAFQAPGELGPIRYTPAQIRPIDSSLNGLLLKDIDRNDVRTLKDGITRRASQIVHDTVPWWARFLVGSGVKLALEALIDWEFSRAVQGVSTSKLDNRS
jgi:hypothetical protein